MRKTRLVLIPGVKSLDTIGCLLLFLACPTIAFKGQENREVDTICKSQNLKEFWVDSPWPGDTDNIGWARGYGGGNWPGDSQKQTTCNALTTRSVVKSRRSEDRRMQARRDVSRDDGIETRKIQLENDMRKDEKREVKNRRADSAHVLNFRDSRRTADGMTPGEERRMHSMRVRENRRESRASTRSLNREIRSEREFRVLDSGIDSFAREGSDIRMRSAERFTITTREVIDGNRNSPAYARNLNREIRSKREGREPGNRRAVFNQGSSDSATPSERRTLPNRELIDGRRASRLSIRSLDNKSDKQINTIESRRASTTQERADSRFPTERVGSVEGQNVENRLVDERVSSRVATRSLEREVRSDRTSRAHRDSRFHERIDRKMPEESVRGSERRVTNTRDISLTRTNSVSSIISPPRGIRSDRDIRTIESRLNLRSTERRQTVLEEQRSVERRVGNRRALNERKDHWQQDQRRDVRSEKLDSQVRDRKVSNQRMKTSERRTINAREIIDGQRLPTQSLKREIRYERELMEPEGNRAVRQHSRLADIRLYEGSRIEGRRELENRRDSRLSTRSLDRRIRSDRDAREIEHRRVDQEKDSRIADSERRVDIRREPERANRRSTRLVERETRSADARKTYRNDINEIRNLQESAQIHQRSAAMTRESRRTAEERRANNRRESDSRYAHSLESFRSAEERRVDNRRRSMERRDSMLSIQSLERRVHSEREITNQRTAQDIKGSRLNVADEARDLDYHRADGKRDYRISVRSLVSQPTLSRRDNMNRRTAMDSRRTGTEVVNRNIERANPGRVSRRIVVDESGDERLVRGEQQRRSTLSLHREMRVSREREAEESESRREVDRALTREGRYLGRSSRRTDERQIESRQVVNKKIRSQLLSRSSEDVSRFDRRIQLAQAERETMRKDMRRSERERHARHTERGSLERISRVAEVGRIDTRLVRENDQPQRLTRSTLRDVRSVKDANSDRQVQRVNVRRENADNRRQEVEREIRATKRISPGRLSRHTADAELARDDTPRRLIRDIRTLDNIQNGDRRIRSTQREITRSDRRGDAENESSILDRATPGRINRRMTGTKRNTDTDRLIRDASRSQRLAHQGEIRVANERRAVFQRESRHERREIDDENRQMRLASPNFRRIDSRDPRDAEIRRISKDISLKFESISTFPKEARRSDRQRRVADVERDLSRIVDKRRGNTFTTESNSRLAEFAGLTNKLRRSDTLGRQSDKINAMERDYRWELSNKGNDNFFESSKNALASWLNTDISRTDLNGIAETLMYGGIACFALFSNVNKKVIF